MTARPVGALALDTLVEHIADPTHTAYVGTWNAAAQDLRALIAERDALKTRVTEAEARATKADHELAKQLELTRKAADARDEYKAQADALADGIEHARRRSAEVGIADDLRLEILGSACAALAAYRAGGGK